MRALMPLLLAGCVETVPCAPGYGRLESGACVAVQVPGEAGPDDAVDPVDTGTPDSGAAAAEVAPWAPADIEAALSESLAVGPPTPVELHTAWLGVFDGAIQNCPGSGYDMTRGVEGCSTPAGWVYSGPADYDAGEGETVRRWSLEADSTARRPDGTRLVAGGVVSWRRQELDAGAVLLVGSVTGTFEDDAAAGWLGRGTSARWSWVGEMAADGALSLTIDGGFTPHGGPSVRFEELVFDPTCGGPTGTVWVRRDADCRWARVDLSCSACGPATFADTAAGEVCLDLPGLSTHLRRLDLR